jgi:hypothetical protein
MGSFTMDSIATGSIATGSIAMGSIATGSIATGFNPWLKNVTKYSQFDIQFLTAFNSSLAH